MIGRLKEESFRELESVDGISGEGVQYLLKGRRILAKMGSVQMETVSFRDFS